jgi:hypothetical protein
VRDLAFVGLLTLWAAAVGRRALQGLGVARPKVASDALALALPVGFGLLGLAVLGLGELGWLTPGGLRALLASGAVLGLWPVRRAIPADTGSKPNPWHPKPARNGSLVVSPALPHGGGGSPQGECSDSSTSPLEGEGDREADGWGEGVGATGSRRRDESAGLARAGRGIWDLLFDLALAVGLVGVLLTALTPVTDGDALCYHLQVPKVFLAWGAVGFDPDLHETVYPLGVEALYAVALAFRGPVACRLIQAVLGLVFALNVAALARPALGRRARWAAAVALLVPAVSNGMGAPLNDVALAAFGAAALHAVLRHRDEPTWQNALLAGALGGFAVGVKYPALVWVGLLGIALACARWCCSTRERVTHMVGYALAVVLAGGWWYLRAWLWTGNPVYPFFRHTFGGSGLDVVLDPIKRPLAVTPGNLLTALGPMTLDPERFDSVAHQFGPAFLLFLPGLFLLRPPRRVALVAGLGWAFLTVCLTQRQSMRFLLIAVGPMAVGVAWVAAELRRRGSLASQAVLAILLALLVFEAGIAARRARHGLGVVLGRESAERFLSRREPTVVVGRWIAANLPETARIVGQDHRGYYLPRPYTMELAHRRRTGLAGAGEPPAATVERLRSAGFTHLLLCPPVPEDAVEFDPTLSRRLAPWLESRTPLYRADLADADGVVRRYAIYALGEETPETLAEARR